MSKNENENFFVQVTLTPEQARTVVTALDLFSRVHIGQFNIIQEQFSDVEDRDQLDALLLAARGICFPDLAPTLNHSHGINGCPSEIGKIAWDVQQVIRQTESYGRQPEGGMTVNFNDPLFVSDSVPRPVAKNVTILDRLAAV